MTIECDKPFYADEDPTVTSNYARGYGIARTLSEARTAAGNLAITNALAAGKSWFDAQKCSRKCPDKQGGYSHGGDASAFNVIAHLIPAPGLEWWIVEASCQWNGVVICRHVDVET